MRIRIPSENPQGVWHDFDANGQIIRIKIRPTSPEGYAARQKKHIQNDFVKDPELKRMVKVSDIDTEAFTRELIDWMIEDVEGVIFEDENGNPISTQDIKTKMALLTVLTSPDSEKSIINFILEKSIDLSKIIDAEEEKQEKNS